MYTQCLTAGVAFSATKSPFAPANWLAMILSCAAAMLASGEGIDTSPQFVVRWPLVLEWESQLRVCPG